MSDLISRNALIEFARNHKDCMVDANDIARFPAVDAVEVVRCGNRAYYTKAEANEKGFLICPASGMEITELDYCSYGERRSE